MSHDPAFVKAVEVKEGLDPKAQDVTSASITYQTFFNLYKKLAGMTVTFATCNFYCSRKGSTAPVKFGTTKNIVKAVITGR